MKKLLTLIALGLFLAFPVLAEERIDDFTAVFDLRADGSVLVKEEITYNFSELKKHGIYRDIPYKYTYLGGKYNLRLSDFRVLDAENNQQKFSVSNKGMDKRIKIGEDDKFVSGEQKYTLSYQVRRIVNFTDNDDEFYWNATGDQWLVPIKQSRVLVNLPVPVPEKDLVSLCFSGVKGSTDACISHRYEYFSQGMVKSISFVEDGLNPGEGLTLLIKLPKGIIAKPSNLANILYILIDNWILALPIFVFFVLLLIWLKNGRDAKGRGVVVAQYEIPDGLTPAEIGAVYDERVDRKDVSAEIIHLARSGFLKIKRTEEKQIIGKKIDYVLEKTDDDKTGLTAVESLLMSALFKTTTVKLSDLKDVFYKDLKEIESTIYASLTEKGYFVQNPQKIRNIYTVIGVFVLVLGWFSGPIFDVIGVIGFFISGALIIIFGFFMPRKTAKGSNLKELIEGLRLYLGVAEKDRLDFHNAPSKNPEQFEKFLPYAMVLGVEKDWSKQFEGLYQKNPDWYSDASGGRFSAIMLSQGLGNFSREVNSTLASRPSSSSTGGGFAGGGGGGGGGSW